MAAPWYILLMLRKVAVVLVFAGGARAQSAEQLRALIAATPRLPLQPLAIAPAGPDLGTVSSVAMDPRGAIYILQRGDKADPVIVVNREGRVLRSWGKGMYKVPHSIRVDPQGNIWTVDAGSSTLLEFTPEGRKLQQIEAGEVATADKCAFPTLCGATDVAFGPDGRLFISDGYGNARILEYTADGKRVKVWGSAGSGPGQFKIPHGVATDGKTLFVADRENARIQRFDLDGKYLGEWTHLGRPFALKMSVGALWAASMTTEAAGRGGDSKQGPRPAPFAFQIDPASGKVLGQIEFSGPHSIDVNAAGELAASGCCGGSNPMGVWLFHR